MMMIMIDLINENCFSLKKGRSRRYPAETLTGADIALLANKPTRTKSMLHIVEHAAAGISLYVNANKMEYMSFKR